MSDKGPRWGRPRSPPSPPLLSPARSDRGAPHGPIAEPRSPPGVPDVTAWGGHPGLEEGGEGGWGGLWVLVGPSLHRSPPPSALSAAPGAALTSLLSRSRLSSGKLQDLGVVEGSKLTLVPTVEAGLMVSAPLSPPPYPPPVCLSVPNTPCSSCRQPPMLPPGSAFPWLRSQGCVEIVEVTPSARSRPLLLCICNVNSPPHTPHTPPLPYFLSIFSHRFPVPGIQAGAIGDASAGKLN